ncbi:Fic family protein [Nocardia rhamnosiphila]
MTYIRILGALADSKFETMSTPDRQSAVYRPFPSFAEWEPAGFDATAFDRYADLLSSAKKAASPEALEYAMTSARRYAAIETGAIEGLYTVDRGFTRTIATQAAAWEAMMDSRGAHVRPAFDDALTGYEYVLDACTQSVEVTELWIKELHQIICKSQEKHRVYTPTGPQDQPLPKGKYKTMPNSPTLPDGQLHAYAPVLDTGPEMQRLVNELRSESFLSAHPIVQAAYAHYAYVCVHPFADGNGRVARALGSVYLYRNPGVPLIVFADQRAEYYDALQAADRGDYSLFIQFIASRVIDSVGIVRSMLNRNSSPAAVTAARLSKLFDGNTVEAELSAAATRLRGVVVDEAKKQIMALGLPAGIKIEVYPTLFGRFKFERAYYRPVGREGSWAMRVRCSWPYEMDLFYSVYSFVKKGDPGLCDFLMLTEDGGEMEVWFREIQPVVTEALKLKVQGFIESTLSDLLVLVEKRAHGKR